MIGEVVREEREEVAASTGGYRNDRDDGMVYTVAKLAEINHVWRWQ